MTNCLNCGKCAGVCPENLICAKLAQAAAADDMDTFLKYHGMECIDDEHVLYLSCKQKYYTVM